MMSAAADFTSFRFSTADLPPAQRLPMWHDIFGRSVSRRMLSLLAGGSCQVDMTVRTLARSGRDCGVCVQRMFLAGGLSARRTSELLSDGNDDVVLHVHETGRRIVSQLDREATVEAGGGLLTSNADVSAIVLPEPSRFTSIGVPRQLMMALVPDLEDMLVRPLPPNAGVLRLLMGYLDLLEDERALSTPQLQHAAATHIHDLCALAVGASRDAAEVARGRGMRGARLRAIKADIAGNLGSGHLSAATLARRQGVTPRYVHKLFESEGTTLSRYVLGLRLAHVHRRLADPRHAHRTISSLVFEAGFGDLSTFNRAFRRCYGTTPSEVRAMTPA
ncbi:AraC family transcriptional regulator [Vineibacter terrae]|uniref:AraC family transcriptional regulator n=1 Tax=Vineibacter terrae TaxID=2586908 RepID=UPI002E307DE4|nr:AraC family transcriptional regulator [Vineibacter terrae]HEX2884891.1 AraC family transcriptional regulator [Vineibacter terrae]